VDVFKKLNTLPDDFRGDEGDDVGGEDISDDEQQRSISSFL
jgi:hypothetical protein